VIYIDTSAATKLVNTEAESPALAVYMAEHISIPVVSSMLLYPELVRSVTRNRPEQASRALVLLQRIMMVPLSNEIVVNAASVGTPMLRTLDALHVATALAIKEQVDVFLAYDKRLIEAATAAGFNTLAPM
jgi:predicted nucleic acid-binding protein